MFAALPSHERTARVARWANSFRESGIDTHVQLCHHTASRFELMGDAVAEEAVKASASTGESTDGAAVPPRPSAEFTMLLALGAIPASVAPRAEPPLREVHATAPDAIFQTGVVHGTAPPPSACFAALALVHRERMCRARASDRAPAGGRRRRARLVSAAPPPASGLRYRPAAAPEACGQATPCTER